MKEELKLNERNSTRLKNYSPTRKISTDICMDVSNPFEVTFNRKDIFLENIERNYT